ncbi:hypothetical protein ACFYUY_04745 [Kitasatospora sp. NPDC004745]|uniref:hypothetical protein n=1 Tax=Kitasatospora sp. NPDC004745 TaxID=3364019 RepID=UPI0036BEFC59
MNPNSTPVCGLLIHPAGTASLLALLARDLDLALRRHTGPGEPSTVTYELCNGRAITVASTTTSPPNAYATALIELMGHTSGTTLYGPVVLLGAPESGRRPGSLPEDLAIAALALLRHLHPMAEARA